MCVCVCERACKCDVIWYHWRQEHHTFIQCKPSPSLPLPSCTEIACVAILQSREKQRQCTGFLVLVQLNQNTADFMVLRTSKCMYREHKQWAHIWDGVQIVRIAASAVMMVGKWMMAKRVREKLTNADIVVANGAKEKKGNFSRQRWRLSKWLLHVTCHNFHLRNWNSSRRNEMTNHFDC